MSLLLVLTTLEAETDAAPLAQLLVEERLAACVNVLPPMLSIYRWKGAVEQAREQQLIIKTSADRLDALKARLVELHPYEVPEVVVIGADGAASYEAWLAEAVRPT
ncbi:MAG: divalent-cation tolerance protein CutA [Vicinamibacterales bacterium]